MLSDKLAELPLGPRPSGKTAEAASPTIIAFAEELTGEQQKLSAAVGENNAHSISKKNRAASKENIGENISKDKAFKGDCLEVCNNGISIAMHSKMPSFATISSEFSIPGKTFLEDDEVQVSFSADQDKAPSQLIGPESFLPEPIFESPSATRVDRSIESADQVDSATKLEQTWTELANEAPASVAVAPSTQTTDSNASKDEPVVVAAPVSSTYDSASKESRVQGAPQQVSDAPRASAEPAPQPQLASALSVSTPKNEVIQGKDAALQTGEAPMVIHERPGQTVQLSAASKIAQSSEATPAKELPASKAEDTASNAFSNNSRSLRSSESSRNVAAPTQNAGAVASRSISGSLQPVEEESRKNSPRARAASRARHHTGSNRFSQSPANAESSMIRPANLNPLAPGSPVSKNWAPAIGQLAELEGGSLDPLGKEISSHVPRDETTGNVSAAGNLQRADANITPRTASVETLFTRMNQGVEQLKQEKLNSIQLRMTLDQGESVRIHLNLRGQSLRTIIFTDSETLRAAFRDGWDSFSRALSEKGVEANELQFSLNDQSGKKSSAQDRWEEKDLREREFATSARRRSGSNPNASLTHLSAGANSASELSTQRFTRFA